MVEDTQVKRLKDHKQMSLGSKSCFKSLSEYKLVEGSIAEEAARYGIYSKNELKNDLVDVMFIFLVHVQIMKSYNAKVTAMKGNSATFSSDLESSDSESDHFSVFTKHKNELLSLHQLLLSHRGHFLLLVLGELQEDLIQRCLA